MTRFLYRIQITTIGIDYAELVVVANDISQNFMKTCIVRCPQRSTVIEDFILGKRD